MLKVLQLKPGSTVRVVPLGKLVEVHYNDKGVISGVFNTNGEKCLDKLDSSLCFALQKNNIVPSRLVNAFDVAVRGVLVHDKDVLSYIQIYGVDNEVEAAIQTSEVSNVKFFAFYMQNDKVKHSAHQSQTALQMIGFETCMPIAVNQDMSNSSLYKLPAMSCYPFVSGYAVLDSQNGINFMPANVDIFKVASIDTQSNKNGYIEAHAISTSGKQYVFPYTSVVKYNVQSNSIVAYDEGVKYCSDSNNLSKKVSNEIRCSDCGALIKVPVKGFVKCCYDNCTSNIYPVVEHMCNVFNVPVMDYAVYRDLVDTGTIKTVCDVFDYVVGNSEVECTAANVLDAVCPPGVVRSKDFFDKIVEFSKSIESLMYYLEEPMWINKDMSTRLNPIDCNAFVDWVSIPENLLNIKFLMQDDRIKIITNSVHLDNVPLLLRNKTIYVEGEAFLHGSYSDVAGILKSYGAEIAPEFNNRCSCVLVSSVIKNVNVRESVKLAQCYNIPVFMESNFFNHYGIDNDLEAGK